MIRKPSVPVRHANSHHALLTDAWVADVEMLEAGIGEFAEPPVKTYHVALFEMAGDCHLHVNVTHKCETRPVKGWIGPGVSADGFIHSRMFESAPTAAILRSIRQMVFSTPS